MCNQFILYKQVTEVPTSALARLSESSNNQAFTAFFFYVPSNTFAAFVLCLFEG